MPQNDIAKNLIDIAERPLSAVRSVLNTVNKYVPSFGIAESKPDTSWHDQMVREANASFAKAQATTSHQAGHQRIKAKYGK